MGLISWQEPKESLLLLFGWLALLLIPYSYNLHKMLKYSLSCPFLRLSRLVHASCSLGFGLVCFTISFL